MRRVVVRKDDPARRVPIEVPSVPAEPGGVVQPAVASWPPPADDGRATPSDRTSPVASEGTVAPAATAEAAPTQAPGLATAPTPGLGPGPLPAPGDAPALLTACCIVNGVQCLTVTLPFDATEGAVEEDAAPLIQHKPRVNGRVELEFVFFTPNVCAPDSHRAGRIVVDGGTLTAELGPLQRERPIHSAVFVAAVPRRLRLEVRGGLPCPATHPASRLLALHCHAILAADEYCGSVASSHLQNQLRELPFYADAFVPLGPHATWTDFVRAHPDLWDVFRYSLDDIRAAGISATCRPREYRLVAREHAGDEWRLADIRRDTARASSERDLHELLCSRLRVRPYEQSELLRELASEPAFLALITPNLSKLLDTFEQHPERYFVLRNHLHPLLVERRRAGTLDDPRFDVWDNTPGPEYSFDFPDAEGW